MKTYIRVFEDMTQKSDNPNWFIGWGGKNNQHVDYEINFDTLEVVRITPEKPMYIEWKQGLKLRNSLGMTYICSTSIYNMTKKLLTCLNGEIYAATDFPSYTSLGFYANYWEVVE